MTKFVHGEEGLRQALQATEVRVQGGRGRRRRFCGRRCRLPRCIYRVMWSGGLCWNDVGHGPVLCTSCSRTKSPLAAVVPASPLQALKPGSSTQLDAETLEAVAGDAPSASLGRAQVVGLPLVDLMVTVGLQTSKGQGRK